MTPLRLPRDPLQRARLAFLGLALLAMASAGFQVVLLALESPFRLPALVGLLIVAGSWIRLYRTGEARWWIDGVTTAGLFLYAAALPLPDLGLALFYVALYIHAFYGTRLATVRAGALILAAYLAAQVQYGFWETDVLIPFVIFQVPALVITAAIIRALHETLLTRRQLSRELEKMIQMEAVTRLTGGIAHDFNNLLTAITGSLDLALSDMDEADASRPDVLLARETAERASALTKQLLSFSRNAMVQPEPVVVDDAVESMGSLLRHLAGEDVEVKMDLGAGDAVVLIDPPSFEQVLTNLTVNAREAMNAADGSTPTLQVSTRRIPGRHLPESSPLQDTADRRREYVEVSVRDSGCGMDDATRERAFEPFFTTKDRGSGLGLSTVYGIVTQAEGSVDLSPASPRGTIVRIHLPAMAGDVGGAPGGATESDSGRRSGIPAD